MSNDTVVSLFPDAQNHKSLSETEVNTDTIKSAFASALIDCEVDSDGDLYISDGVEFPFWLMVDQPSKLICYRTYWPTDVATAEEANRLNSTFKMVQFAAVGDRIMANYSLTYRYGLDARHLIVMARKFSSICRAARTSPPAEE